MTAGISRAAGARQGWMMALALACVALTLVGIGEALAKSPANQRSKKALTQEELLARLADQPDILINVTAYDLPSTTDLVLLGNRATPALVNCVINNLNESARATCAQVLATTRDQRALPTLIAALDDPSRGVQYYAVEALSQVEARTATGRLLEIMGDERRSESTRDMAIAALGRSGDPAAIAPLMTTFQETLATTAQNALWDMRQQLTPAQLESLVIAPLKAEPEDVSWGALSFAVEVAGDLKITAAAPLLMDLVTSKRGDTNRVVYNLGLIGDPQAIGFLKGLVDMQGEARLLNNVMFALQRLGEDVSPLLRAALTNERAYIRYNAAFVIGDLKEARMVPDLIKALEDINDIVRSEAAEALGHIGDRAALQALEKAARAPEPNVRISAFKAMLAIDYAAYQGQAWAAIQAEVAKDADEDTDEEGDEEVREQLLSALAAGDMQPLLSQVFRMLDPTDYQDREVGVMLLNRFQQMSNPEALAFLIRAAADQSHDAFRLLARFADPRTAFILGPWMAHPGDEPSQLLRALARLKAGEYRDFAQPYLKRKGQMSQLYAAFYLASLGDADAMSMLLGALENATLEQKRVVAIILTELDYTAISGAEERLRSLLTHEDVYVRLYAARPLAHRNDQAAINALRQELNKKIPFIHDEVIAIVKQLPREQRDQLLKQWLADASEMLRHDLSPLLRSDAEGDEG
jgi:HEAT repeat protein